MKVRNSFYTSLLRPSVDDPVEGQVPPPAPPVIVEGTEEWEVKRILDCRRKGLGFQYCVSWINHPLDITWYPAKNFANSTNKIQQFHNDNPDKPCLTNVVVSCVEAAP